MKIKTLFTISIIVLALLSIPLIAMQFSEEVNWDVADFVIMGVLLFATGAGIASVLRFKKFKIILIALIVFIFLVIWAELAVGIFGSPFAGS